jgi:ribosomal protein L11 methyltransferase
MPSSYIEVRVRTNVDSGELIAMLGETLGSWEKDGLLYIYWPEGKWVPSILEDLKRALAKLGVTEQEAGLTVRSIPDMDWDAAWASSLQPIQIGRCIRIRQSWHPSAAGADRIELVIDPKRAFGTGHHATTQLLIEWLEDRIRGGERILDIGTGSGILAMVAIRLGAASALAIDNDPVALECAQEYSRMNGFGSELELRVAAFEDLDRRDRFDVIVANLDGRTLVPLCGSMPRMLHPGGCACFSGLQLQDYEEIAEALKRADLEISARMEREDWLALNVRRRL